MPDKDTTGKSRAKRMQEAAQLPTADVEEKPKEQSIRITLRTSVGAEYHLEKPATVVRGILDPDTPDALIEVPIMPPNSAVKRRFIHTNQIAELDIHDELEELES